VAERGRDPEARLDRAGEEIAPAAWGAELLGECEPIAAALDRAHGNGRHGEVLAAAGRALRDSRSLPSAQVLRETAELHATSFPALVLARSRANRDAVAAMPMAPEALARHASLAAQSLAEQQRIEAGDDMAFEDYRRAYLEQDLMGGSHFKG
jgi:glutamate--cysteine ligase